MIDTYNEWQVEIIINRDSTNDYQWKGKIYDSSLKGIYHQLDVINDILKEENHNYVFFFKKRNQETRRWRRQYVKSIKFHEREKLPRVYKRKCEYIAKLILFGNETLHADWSTWLHGVDEQDLNTEIEKFKRLAKAKELNYVYFIYKRSPTKGKWIASGEETVINKRHQNIEEQEERIRLFEVNDVGEIVSEIEINENGEVLDEK